MWQLGNPEGPSNMCLQLCQQCVDDLLTDAAQKVAQQGDSPGFACEYCGKKFDNEKSRQMHSIRCPQKKEGG